MAALAAVSLRCIHPRPQKPCGSASHTRNAWRSIAARQQLTTFNAPGGTGPKRQHLRKAWRHMNERAPPAQPRTAAASAPRLMKCARGQAFAPCLTSCALHSAHDRARMPRSSCLVYLPGGPASLEHTSEGGCQQLHNPLSFSLAPSSTPQARRLLSPPPASLSMRLHASLSRGVGRASASRRQARTPGACDASRGTGGTRHKSVSTHALAQVAAQRKLHQAAPLTPRWRRPLRILRPQRTTAGHHEKTRPSCTTQLSRSGQPSQPSQGPHL